MKPSSSKPTITRNRHSQAAIDADNIKLLKNLNLPLDTPITKRMIRKSKAFSDNNPTVSTSRLPSIAPSVPPVQVRATPVTRAQVRATPVSREQALAPLVVPQPRPNDSLIQFRPIEEAAAEATKPRFDDINLAFLINHLSSPTNHDKLLGSGAKTQVGGLSRGSEWNILASTICIWHNNRLRITNTSSSAKLNIDGAALAKRWGRIKATYIETKAHWKDTGQGLSDKDVADGFTSVEQKKEAQCPMFNELERMYGNKPNITALSSYDSSIPRIPTEPQPKSPSPNNQEFRSTSQNQSPVHEGDLVNSRDNLNSPVLQEDIPTFLSDLDQINLLWTDQGLDDLDPYINFVDVESTTTDNNLSNANFSQSGLNRFEDDRFGNDQFGNDQFEDDQFGIDQFGNDRLQAERSIENRFQEDNLNQNQFQENNLNQNQFQDDNSNQNQFHNDNLIEIDLQDDNLNQNHLRDDNLIEIDLQDDNLNQNQLTEDRLNENDPKPKTQSKKALQASQRLAKRPAKPLPALNANDVKKRKSIENSLKESSSERLKFYEEQIKASTSKQDERAQAAADAAAAALEFKQKKWDLQLEREDAKMASESMRALQITKLNNENEERKARREAIECCHKEDMPMEQMKEYIAFLFPPSDKV